MCEAVIKTSSLASAAGELANVSEQLASEFEKEIGNMNVFTALKKAINLEVKLNCHKEEAIKGLLILFVSLV